MRRILVVEDHPLLRESMAQALSQLPDASVTAVGTVQTAKAALEASRHDLVVSDLDLPDGSGVELMGQFGTGGRVAVIFISAHVPRYRTELHEFPGVTVREKPVSLQDLQQLASDHLDDRDASNELPFGAGDYVQLACMGRHSVSIEIHAGALRGSILVRDGSLWSAAAGALRGVPALQKLLLVAPGSVRCAKPTAQQLDPRNLPDEPWERLMLDAARRHDEAARGLAAAREQVESDSAEDLASIFDEDEPTPGAGHSLATDTTADSALASELERGAEALLTKNYSAALEAYLSAQKIEPGHPLVATNVARLEQLLK